MNYKKLSIILLFGGCVISAYGQEFEIVESLKNLWTNLLKFTKEKMPTAEMI